MHKENDKELCTKVMHIVQTPPQQHSDGRLFAWLLLRQQRQYSRQILHPTPAAVRNDGFIVKKIGQVGYPHSSE
jgi:hypothetical protein